MDHPKEESTGRMSTFAQCLDASGFLPNLVTTANLRPIATTLKQPWIKVQTRRTRGRFRSMAALARRRGSGNVALGHSLELLAPCTLLILSCPTRAPSPADAAHA
jgi:hypothetical protein